MPAYKTPGTAQTNWLERHEHQDVEEKGRWEALDEMFGLSKNEQLAKYLNFKFPEFRFKVTGDVAGKRDGEFDIWWEGSQEISTEVEKWAAWWIGENIEWSPVTIEQF